MDQWLFFYTAGPTTSTVLLTLLQCSRDAVIASSFLTCGGMVRRASYRRTHFEMLNSQSSHWTQSLYWMRLRSLQLSSPGTTGEHGLRASLPPFGRRVAKPSSR